ncbi:unnamed protein product [Litomosoides sigmodontis]|uniref:Uncharacterized protein n=1 Tax=Litomosoides sigmodontis TaxID=42156 RepID=A0A3P6V2T0_LITSI|nr:unnamed protein product [Litomosoides sigmodontis]
MQDAGEISREEEGSVKRLLEWQRRSWYGMSEILPYLYLGGLRDANDVEQLKEKQISCMVSIHELSGRIGNTFNDLNILRIRMADMPEANINEHFTEAVEFIHHARLSKKSVLVHCIAGVSRSVCIVAAYLIAACDMSYAAALAYIVSKRPCANPNFGFRMQLAKYAGKRSPIEAITMRNHFDNEAFDKLKENDKRVLLLSCSATSPWYIPDEAIVCNDVESPPTSMKEELIEYVGCQNNPANKSVISDPNISFIDQ